jgi:hypothetical protein
MTQVSSGSLGLDFKISVSPGSSATGMRQENFVGGRVDLVRVGSICGSVNEAANLPALSVGQRLTSSDAKYFT